MRLAYVTAGGAGMFCGSCMHDNTLAAALLAKGVDVVLVPTFTPIRTDERDVTTDRVFLGGINVYLEERLPFWGRLPAALRRLLDHPRLLDFVASRSLETRRDDDGLLAVSLLRGAAGHQRREVEALARWIDDFSPDLVVLTNLLIAGFVPVLRELLRRRGRDVPVLVTLQGDDIFLDDVRERDRPAVLAAMRRVASAVDGFVVMSAFYRDKMAEMLEIPPERFHIAPLGIQVDDALTRPREERPPGAPRTVGYLARICPEKGLHVLVDAFLRLAERPSMEDVRLRIAGWLGQARQPYLDGQLRRLAAAGLAERVEHVELPDRASKIDFLRGLDVFSVPTVYREPKGLYVLEALAAGVPVVQPAHGAFPEMLAATGGGRLVPPEDLGALTEALAELLSDPETRRRLGDEGRARVLESFHADAMAERNLEIYRRFTD